MKAASQELKDEMANVLLREWRTLRMIRPLDFTSCAIPLALNTLMTACSPFSQKDVRHFIFQLLKPPSLKLPALFSADKKKTVYNLKILHVFADL